MRLGCVAAFGAAALVASAAVAGYTDETGLQFHWALDGLGARPAIPDLSGHGRDGTAYSNVVGGVTHNFKCLDGFTSLYSCIFNTNAVEGVTVWQQPFSFSCWIRNPDMTSTANHFIARGAGKDVNQADRYDSQKQDIGWQLWMTQEGRFAVGVQLTGSAFVTNNLLDEAVIPEPVTFAPDVWYQLTVNVDYESTPVSGNKNACHRRISVYLTPEGAESVGDPVAYVDFELAKNISAKMPNVVVGAARAGYYPVSAPGGYFDGDICEVNLFSRLLDEDDILSDVRSFSHRYHPVDDVALLHWKLDEPEGAVRAADATGHGLEGVLTNGVHGGFRSPSGTAFGGFTNYDCFVCGPMTNADEVSSVSEISFWVRPPSVFGEISVLAGGTIDISTFRNNPWRLGVTEEGRVNLAMCSYSGTTRTFESEPLEWKPSSWYHVLVRHDRPMWSGEEVTTNGDVVVTNTISRRVEHMKVYVTEAVRGAETFRLGVPVVDGLLDFKTGQFSTWQNFFIGGAEAGYYSCFRPAGSWNGLIDDVFISCAKVEDEYYGELARPYLDEKRPGFLLILR